ncbi:MAG: HD domain-containing protein [Nanoarchaeota archaeon]|nr:HD domain-containing protein [Nanoarchaeota archaeon]MCG2718403.1 HD domain-containing protein [Nanoarchaeota archaeon]
MKYEIAKRLVDKYNNQWRFYHVHKHSMRVMHFASLICDELNIKGWEKKKIEIAAKYHDIGKLSYTKGMLSEKRKFTQNEIKLAKKHAEFGYKIIKAFHKNESIAEIVKYHHEKLDGSGYPDGLTDKDISLSVKIITVCDAYDAMFRHYSKKTKEEAFKELKKNSGTQFDKDVVDALLRMEDEI